MAASVLQLTYSHINLFQIELITLKGDKRKNMIKVVNDAAPCQPHANPMPTAKHLQSFSKVNAHQEFRTGDHIEEKDLSDILILHRQRQHLHNKAARCCQQSFNALATSGKLMKMCPATMNKTPQNRQFLLLHVW